MIKNLPANAGNSGGFNPWVGKIPWRRKCSILAGKSSLWGHKESDVTEHTYSSSLMCRLLITLILLAGSSFYLTIMRSDNVKGNTLIETAHPGQVP